MAPRNPTSYVILGLLSIQPNLSGYDMRKAVQGSIGHFWGESYGQIYPALKQLAGEGLIAPTGTGSNGRKLRQEYILTEAGRDCLRAWLAVPFQNEPPRNEFLLKLFFAHQAAPGVAISHLRDLQERNRRMLDALQKIETSVPAQQPMNPNLPYWMLTLSLGKALTCAALEWGESALAQLSTSYSPAAPSHRPLKTRSANKISSPRKQLKEKGRSTRTER
jgi:DNA-binding PadR family transcriptional regulator